MAMAEKMRAVHEDGRVLDVTDKAWRSTRMAAMGWSLEGEATAKPPSPPSGSHTPPEPQTASEYDPSEHTVEEVNAHLDVVQDQTERERILSAEREGKARKTILEG